MVLSMNIKSKKIIAYLSAVAIMFPTVSIVQDVQNNISVSAEDVSTEVDLVDGKVPSPAEDFEYNLNGKNATITKYNGTDDNVVIPHYIDGNIVRAIGQNAFKDSYIVSATIPNTVTLIDGTWNSLNSSNSSGAFINSSVKEVIFEENSIITTIGQTAFYNCTSLMNINLPDSITSIERSAFSGCINLSKINLPKDLSYISTSTFNGCKALKEITFPENETLNSIGDSAFNGCSSLTELNLPKGLISIGNSTFNGCSSLTAITFPESLTSIGDSAFVGTALKTLELPNNVQSIGKEAFKQVGISNLILPENITIGNDAFYETSIDKLELKDGTSLGSNAFCNCNNLVEVTTIGKVELGIQSFFGCEKLYKVTVSKDTTIAENAVGIDSRDILDNYYINKNTTIYGYIDTPAYTYATSTGIKFVDLDHPDLLVENITGDCNHDGKINIMDLLTLKKYILGIIESFNEQ